MTRFVKAKSSKASTEHVPKNGTSCSIVKRARKNKGRQKQNKIQQEITINKNIKYSAKKPKKDKNMDCIISENGILNVLKPSKGTATKGKKLSTEIVEVFDKTKLNKNKTQIFTEITANNKENENDRPEEISAKVQQQTELIIKKPKIQKTLLKIGLIADSQKRKTDFTSKNAKRRLRRLRLVRENVTNEKNLVRRPTTEFKNNSVKQNTDSLEKNENILTKSMKRRLRKERKLEANKANNKNNKVQTKILNDTNKNQRKSNKLKENNEVANKLNKVDNINPNKRKSSNNNYEKPNKIACKESKVKALEVRDNPDHKNLKPDNNWRKTIVNGIEIKVVKVKGLLIKKEDSDRLTKLKKQMIKKGIPLNDVKRTLLLERRKAQKALAKLSKFCSHCQKTGHLLSNCSELNSE